MKKLAVMALAAATSSVWAVQGTITVGQTKHKGDIVWKAASNSYAVTKGKATANYTLDQVEAIDIPKPENLDKAIASKNITELTKIVKEYRMLTWDKAAGRALVSAYLDTNPDKAYEAAQAIIKDDKASAYTGDLALAYWQVLFKLNKTTQLENCLRKAVSDGDRRSSAEALVMRGDILSHADTQEAHRKALIDGYLRVALMYTDQDSIPARREALKRCEVSFKKIGMSAYAAEMAKMLQEMPLQ